MTFISDLSLTFVNLKLGKGKGRMLSFILCHHQRFVFVLNQSFLFLISIYSLTMEPSESLPNFTPSSFQIYCINNYSVTAENVMCAKRIL